MISVPRLIYEAEVKQIPDRRQNNHPVSWLGRLMPRFLPLYGV